VQQKKHLILAKGMLGHDAKGRKTRQALPTIVGETEPAKRTEPKRTIGCSVRIKTNDSVTSPGDKTGSNFKDGLEGWTKGCGGV